MESLLLLRSCMSATIPIVILSLVDLKMIQDARAFVVRGAVCSHRKEGIGRSVAAQTTKNEKPITVQLIWTELSIWLLLLFLLARLLRLICGSLMRN